MAEKPVVDLRTYTIKPRGMAEFLDLFDRLAVPIQLKHLGPPLGFFVSDIGPSTKGCTCGGTRASPITIGGARRATPIPSGRLTRAPRGT